MGLRIQERIGQWHIMAMSVLLVYSLLEWTQIDPIKAGRSSYKNEGQ